MYAKQWKACRLTVSVFSLCILHSFAFGGVENLCEASTHLINEANLGHSLPDIPTSAFASTVLANPSHGASELFARYKEALDSNPLEMKMATGGVIAVIGDAIAQASEGNDSAREKAYDLKRAGSFAVFDMFYRAAQHVLYPPMMQVCQGQYLGAIIYPLLYAIPSLKSSWGTELGGIIAAGEQALVSQLVIIPLVYYPFFYAVTGTVQGLNPSEIIERARETFMPIMKRNLLFWIPLQFVVFGFLHDENLQIPILTLAGLVWTFILSLFAGSARDYVEDAETILNGGHKIPGPEASTPAVKDEAFDGKESICL